MPLAIVYRSEAVSRLSYVTIADLCLQSARNNQRLGITGFLVEFEGVFLQVIEGDPDQVEALYARIVADPRHRNVELLLREAVHDQPNFGFWAMNFGPLDTPTFWRAVFGAPVNVPEFLHRSHDADFALNVLTRAYMHTCIVAEVDPAVHAITHGAIPQFDGT